jgi:hypothetical protein
MQMNAHARHLADEAPRRLLSVADLDRMIEAGIISDDENVELIDGELIVMAAKKFSHEFTNRRWFGSSSSARRRMFSSALRQASGSIPTPLSSRTSLSAGATGS